MNRAVPAALKAILWDIDGTMIDSHPLIVSCFDYAMQRHAGRPAVVEIWRERVGLPLDDVIRANYSHYGLECDEKVIEEIKATYRAIMKERLGEVGPFVGVVELLRWFREQGIRLGIVSTKFRAIARSHLDLAGISELFEVVIAGDDCDAPKPSPEPFLKALEALGLAPDEVVMVGDSVHDIAGAHAAKIYAVGALWGCDNRPQMMEAGPDMAAEAPAELRALLSGSSRDRQAHLD